MRDVFSFAIVLHLLYEFLGEHLGSGIPPTDELATHRRFYSPRRIYDNNKNSSLVPYSDLGPLDYHEIVSYYINQCYLRATVNTNLDLT